MSNHSSQGQPSAGQQPAAPGRGRPRLLQVVRVEQLTPHMRRVTLGGDEMAGFPSGREGSHVKVLLPRPGQPRPVLPTPGPKGPQWPPPEQRPIARTYTIRRYDSERCELDIDFVLHSNGGPASQWATKAQPGDWVGIAGPGTRGPIRPDAGYYLFLGDASALPAIAAHLEALPATARGHALVEVAGPADELPLTGPAQVAVNWLHRAAGQASPLPHALRNLPCPPEEVFAWIAGEALTVAALRSYLRAQWGLTARQIEATPFWRAGTAEEQYHDERHHVMDEYEAEAAAEPM